MLAYHISALIAEHLHGEADSLSARFAAREVAVVADPAAWESCRDRITGWILNVRLVTVIVANTGSLPAETGSDDATRRAAYWVRDQRRPATRYRLCAYQVARLELLPGFSWDPAATRLAAQVSAYREFFTTHHRPPRIRSASPVERALAGWAARTRTRLRAGDYDPATVAWLRENGLYAPHTRS